ncbi:MAG: rRNA adenine N(6)-methyltransferase family protein [Aquihabitans sp.]
MGQPRKHWGWHQLESSWAERLVDASGVGRGDLVLDVGAGLGALTRPLVERGAKVIAIERHPDRVDALRRAFDGRLRVVRADAADLRLPRRPFHVVANPPYGITTDLLTRLLHPGSRMVSAHVVLQRDAARRWSSPNAPGARRWQHQWSATLGPAVPRRAFAPPPMVDSQVLRLHRR